MTAAKELWLPPGVAARYRKAAPPKLGERFGQWAGDDLSYFLRMPGGTILQFDLSQLTLGDYRSMKDHYQINISLALLTFMLHQTEWRIDCDDARIRDAATEQLSEMWTRLVRAISQAYWAGYSPVVIQWENDLHARRINFTKFKDLVPEECAVNWKTVDGYAPRSHAKPKLKVYDGIKQARSTFPIPAENTLWYPLLMENGDHYGRKLLRTAFPPWFFSQLIHLFSNRYFERFGEPLPVGRAPFDDELDDGQGGVLTGKEAMENILRGIRNRSSVVLPNVLHPGTSTRGNALPYEYSIEYLESAMRGADFERYLTRLDEEMSLAILTPLLVVRTADVGSYNLGVGHMQVFSWMHNALAGDFKEYLDRYVLDRFVDFNFSPNAARARWIPKKLGKHDAELLRAVVAQIISPEQATPDLDELGTAVGLTLRQVRQVTDSETDGGGGGRDDRRETGARQDDKTPKGADKASAT